MKSITVLFMQVGEVVVARVVSMPEEIRGTGFVFKAGEFEVHSIDSPQITPNELCLRGDHAERDGDIVAHQFETAAGARMFIEMAKRAIADWNWENECESSGVQVPASEFKWVVAA